MKIRKHWAKRISRFKAIELEAYTAPLYFNIHKVFRLNSGGLSMNFNICNLLGCQFNWNRKCDHAGVRLTVILFGIEFSAELYDVRHWDDENDCPVPIDETLFSLK